MQYFGTNLDDHGHYTWDLDSTYMVKIDLLPRNTPFNPEALTKNLQKGETIFYQGGGFTVIGISGSCKDTRPGTKSVFWVNEIISKENMVCRIKDNPHASKMIELMNFKIIW